MYHPHSLQHRRPSSQSLYLAGSIELACQYLGSGHLYHLRQPV
ncbi:Uncharacterised protein [Vibrio cholerae]|nr:Uncharacterised protein [Vibrio cholerae]CSI36515.1 Uncharacterised protein [Vibrio cholerae]CSI48278.1 Uncharacterised protein [Vibrio cholerae]